MRELAKLPPIFGHPEFVIMDEEDLVHELTTRLRRSAILPPITTTLEPKRNFLRTFPSGASRNDDTHKPDPEAFWSPLVQKCYNEYIQSKRYLRDGRLREPDNWQRGMPLSAYAKSLLRHVLDFHLHHRGFGDVARASLKAALCAIIFNTQGYLHELLKEERTNEEHRVRAEDTPA